MSKLLELIDQLARDSDLLNRMLENFDSTIKDFDLSDAESDLLRGQLDIPENSKPTSLSQNDNLYGMSKYNDSMPHRIKTSRSVSLGEEISMLNNPDYYVRLVTVTTNTITFTMTTTTVNSTTTTTTTTKCKDKSNSGKTTLDAIKAESVSKEILEQNENKDELIDVLLKLLKSS
ncbi:MAG: hypothetical protein ABJO57_14915 [Lentilitoribacter sp.]